MTFYNIIFGILFLAACRQAFLVWGTDAGWAAASLAIMVFNDALNTSHVLERDHAPRYTMWMKIVDLFNFLILSVALVSVKPTDNPFGVALSVVWQTRLENWTAWPLMTAYWGLAIGWNWLAKVYQSDKWPKWLKLVSHLLIVLPGAVTLWVCFVGPPPRWLQMVVFFGFGAYFLLLKPLNDRADSISPA